MAQMCFRIEDGLKYAAENVFERMGLTMSAAINVFLKQTVNRQEFPFAITTVTAPKAVAYWAEIDSRIKDIENGSHFAEHELIESGLEKAHA